MKTRRDLIAFARSGADPVQRIDGATKSPEGCGTLTSDVARGSVLLVPREEGAAPGRVRVFWEAGDKSRGRPVPAGTYRVFNYVIEAEKDGAFWCLSGSGPSGRTVEIAAGGETKLELDGQIHLSLDTRKSRAKLAVMLGITGDHGMGLSVIRGADRVPVSFELQDAAGKRLDGAKMPYG